MEKRRKTKAPEICMFPFILSIWFRFVSPNWVLLFTASVFHFFPLFPLSAAGTKNLKLNIFAFYISQPVAEQIVSVIVFVALFPYTDAVVAVVLFVCAVYWSAYVRTDGRTHTHTQAFSWTFTFTAQWRPT